MYYPNQCYNSDTANGPDTACPPVVAPPGVTSDDATFTETAIATLTRTGTQVPFAEVEYGQVFYFEGIFWTRTAEFAGKDLRRSAQLSVPSYGSCSFGRTPETSTVELVTVTFQ